MGKVAIITGGASGMGLAVTKLLASKGWTVAVLDLNEKAGQEVTAAVANTAFFKANVIEYPSISAAFDAVFEKFGTIDFVFANAGIVENVNFYDAQETKPGSRIPPELNQLVVDINLKSVITTTYLAQHYFRLSPHKGKGASIVMTGSTGALYPAEFLPMYAAAKAGVLNFMRSIAGPFYHKDGIRAHTICPGSVRTNLLNQEQWKTFPPDTFTPIEMVAKHVAMLVEGGDMTDSKGKTIHAGEDFGVACEIIQDRFYFRDQVPYGDETLRVLMGGTTATAQADYAK